MTVKITDLPLLATAAVNDVIEIVDVSDPTGSPEGTSKRLPIGGLPAPSYALDDLSDVTITTPALDNILVFNGSIWVNADPGFGALAFLDFVDTAQIAADAITPTELATNSVTADAIAASAVGTSEIANNAVTSDEIAAGAVGTSEIATNAVTSDEIAAGAVDTSEIASGVTLDDPTLTAYRLTGQTPGITTGVVTIPYGDGNAVKVTVDANITDIQITGWPAGVYAKLDICLQVDATGGYTIDLSGVAGGWPGGAAPDLDGSANARHRLVVVRDADGQVDWTLAGADYA